MNKSQQQGFTLIEVLLVLVVVGLMVAAVSVNISNNKPDQKLSEEAQRFAGVINLAADYGLLNNIELGVYVNENAYQIVGFDGTQWAPIPDNTILEPYELPEEIAIELVFDDLAIEEPDIVDRELFLPEEEDLEGMRENLSDDEKPIVPQIYLLSGGDITPFKAEFTYREQLDLDEEYQFDVIGHYTTPVEVIDIAAQEGR